MPARRLASPWILLLLCVSFPTFAAPIREVPIQVPTPDGRVLDLLASGDEFFRRVTDGEGFTVIPHPISGEVVYADLRERRLVPTNLVVGRDSPWSAGLRPGLRPSPVVMKEMRDQWTAWVPRPRRSAPTRGTMNNLVLFVRFADEAPIASPFRVWQEMFNGTPQVQTSLRAYYQEVSYGTLTIDSHFLPRPDGDTVLSYQDPNPRSYFQKYHPVTNPGGYQNAGEAMVREQQMVRRALEATIHDLPPGLDLDGDRDGFVDNLVVIISGSPDGWSDLLWPHMTLQLADLIYLEDLIVLTYNLQLHDLLVERNRVGVLAHEMFHTLGAPDLYHYSDDEFTPAGPWDLMENDLSPPQHMSLHMKVRYGGWASNPPLITESGSYLVRPLTEPEGQGWRLPIPGEPKQHFLVEYRRRVGAFETSLPEEGLLIWRVDERWYGNSNGPPDELYVFRPQGTSTQNGQVRRAPFSEQSGRTAFTPETDPSPFTQYGSPVGLRITAVTATGGDLMGFTVCMAYHTCFLHQCGDDGCGGSCGECPQDRVCEEGICRDRQRCETLAACLRSCPEGDDPCRDHCGRVPVECPSPGICVSEGVCDPLSGDCRYPPLPQGTPCQDGDPCTGEETCDGEGRCLGEPDPACLAPDPEPDAGGPDTSGPDGEDERDAVPVETAEPTADLPVVEPPSIDIPPSLDPSSTPEAAEDPPSSPESPGEGPDEAAGRLSGGGGCSSGFPSRNGWDVVLLCFLCGALIRRRSYRWWQGRSSP